MSKCYDNKLKTTYNPEYPTAVFLQRLVDDSLYSFTFSTPDDCRVTVFEPTPASLPCTNRHIILKLHDDVFVSDSGSLVYNEPEFNAPKVEIPLNAQTMIVRLICEASEKESVVGFQFLLENEIVHCERFRKPILLDGTDKKDLQLVAEQLMGFPPHDGKQQGILGGDISPAGIMPCTSCICERRFLESGQINSGP